MCVWNGIRAKMFYLQQQQACSVCLTFCLSSAMFQYYRRAALTHAPPPINATNSAVHGPEPPANNHVPRTIMQLFLLFS